MMTQYAGKNVLAVGAHPDDLELAVGGTLAELSRRGAKVTMVVLCVPNDLERRIAESKQAAEILGCDMRILIDDRPCRVEDLKLYEIVERMDALVYEYEPVALFTHSRIEFHNDHSLMHQAWMSSQRLTFFDVFFMQPATCRPLPLRFQPDIYVDITSTIDRKMAAIDCHFSQFKCRGIETGFQRDVSKVYGKMIGVEFAEGLQVHRMLLR